MQISWGTYALATHHAASFQTMVEIAQIFHEALPNTQAERDFYKAELSAEVSSCPKQIERVIKSVKTWGEAVSR